MYLYLYTYIKHISKFAGPHGPTACQTSHLMVFIIDSSISLIVGRRPGTLDPLNRCTDVPRVTPGCTKDQFLLILRRPKSTSKIQRCFESSEIDQNGILNRPWCASGSLFDEKAWLWASLRHRLFDLFENLQKHRLHCKANTCYMFFAFKTILFSIHFS